MTFGPKANGNPSSATQVTSDLSFFILKPQWFGIQITAWVQWTRWFRVAEPAGRSAV